jgi:hypothetical protein
MKLPFCSESRVSRGRPLYLDNHHEFLISFLTSVIQSLELSLKLVVGLRTVVVTTIADTMLMINFDLCVLAEHNESTRETFQNYGTTN